MKHIRVRRSRTASALILVLAAIASASLASSAAAAVRYVTPAGGGDACTQAIPCDIGTGIAGAADGDEVVVGTGTYGSDATPVAISFPASGSITVHGAEIGPGRPVIHVSGTLTVTGANSLLSDVDLESISPQTLLVVLAGRADRIVANQSTTTATVNTCQVAGSAVLTNSLCIRTNGDFSSAGLLMLDGAVARNVTVGSTGTGVFGNPSLTGTLANSIANAISTDIAFAGGTPALPNDYFEDFTPATPPTAPGRVSAGLSFRSPADFRQAPLSTTIDAGSAAETLGDLDLDGNLRVVGSAPDIGAYEDVPPPAVAIGAVVPEATTATVVPQVTTGGGRTSLTLDYGTAAGGPYTATTQQVVPADLAPSQPQVALSGLTPGTTYYYRLSVSSDGGSAGSAEGSFTTVSAPTATAGPATDVTSTTATLTGTVDTMGGAAQVSFQYTPAGGAALTTPVQNVPAATGAQPVTAAVSGLTPATAYDVAVIVTNSAGTATSATSGFTTPAASSPPQPPVSPPVASAGASSHVGLTGGIVTGTVDTRGLAGTVHFEVIPPDGGPAVTTADQPLPPGAHQVGAAVSGLKPGTSYGVVVVATTAAGTTRSAAGTLTTLRDTRAPTVRVLAPAGLAIGRTTALTPRVICGEPCTVRVVARLGVRSGRRRALRPLANARITVRLTPVTRTAAADTDVHLNLTRARSAALAAMGPGRRVVVRLQITATDAAGNRRTVVRFVGLRRA